MVGNGELLEGYSELLCNFTFALQSEVANFMALEKGDDVGHPYGLPAGNLV